MSNSKLLTIVVIEDDIDHGKFIAALLQRAGYRVSIFRDAMAAMTCIHRSLPELVLTDIFMPNMDGFEVVRHLKQRFPQLPVIAMSGNLGQWGTLYLESIVMQGATAALPKPVSAFELLATINHWIDLPRKGASCT